MSDQFVPMFKDGETIRVHPDIVKEHETLGWVVVVEAEKSIEPKLKTANNDTAPKAEVKKTARAGKKVK
jgi:hypothetical protein